MTVPDLFITVLINVVGGIITVIVVLFVFERHRRPDLDFEVEAPPHNSQDVTFLRVLVKNKPLNRVLSWAYAREPALMCRAWITFYYDNMVPVHSGRKMIGRWSETPNAKLDYQENEKGEFVWVLTNPEAVRDWIDIPPNGQTPLDVAAKSDVLEGKFVGWDGAYFSEERGVWRFDQGQYFCKIQIQTGGREFPGYFRIICKENDFRLHQLNDKKITKQLK